jgi:hypothetical protein
MSSILFYPAKGVRAFAVAAQQKYPKKPATISKVAR